MKKESILKYVVGFPLFFHIITYYGFQSSYFNYINEQSISDFYYQNIYAYRLLSRELLEGILSLGKVVFGQDIPMKEYILQKGTLYYHALFLMNSFFAVCSSLVLNFILSEKKFFPEVNTQKRLVIVFIMASIMAFSQFVVVHYDNSAIFLMLLGVYFTFKYYDKRKIKDLFLLCLIVTISALNRETAALNISFLASLFIVDFRNINTLYNNFVKNILPVIIAFVLPYFVLRVFIPQVEGGNGHFFESITLVKNFLNINNIIGVLYGILLVKFLLFFVKDREDKVLVYRFLFFSSPYIVMILFVGVMWEIRLYIPIIYGLVLLVFFNDKSRIKIK